MRHLHSDHRMVFEVQPGGDLQEAYSVRINLREAFGLVWLGFSRLYWSRLRLSRDHQFMDESGEEDTDMSEDAQLDCSVHISFRFSQLMSA